MKARSCKVKINQLVREYGKKELANKLGLHLSYIYKMQHGMIPGKRLYRDIIQLYEHNNLDARR